MKKENRSASLDLIRCMTMLFVVVAHSFLHNGYDYHAQKGIAMWLAGSFRWLSISCIGLFFMLTGYLQSEKTSLRTCYRGIVSILVTYLLASIVSFLVSRFVFHNTQTVIQWLKLLVQFGGVAYGWYVVYYLLLTLLIPFVNVMIKHLSNKGFVLLTIVLLIITALPGATPLPIVPSYWKGIYPLTFYVLGALIHRLQPKVPVWAGILCAVGTAIAMGTVTILSTDQGLAYAINWEIPDIWLALIGVSLFVSLYKISIPACFHKILAFGANGCLGACMLSHLLDGWCYKIFPLWRTPSRYILLFLCVSVPIYFVSLVAGNLLQKCANIPAKYISKVLNLLPGEPLDSDEGSVK